MLRISMAVLPMFNFQRFLNCESIIASLKEVLDNETFSPEVLRMLCKLFQTFVLNDDIRAEFPHGHQHACQIANEFIDPLIKRLKSEDRILFPEW